MLKGCKYYNPLPPTSGRIQLVSLGLASASYCFCLQPLEVGYNYYYTWRSYNYYYTWRSYNYYYTWRSYNYYYTWRSYNYYYTWRSYNYYYTWRSYNREGTQYCACMVRMQHCCTTQRYDALATASQVLNRKFDKGRRTHLCWWYGWVYYEKTIQYYNNAQSDVNDTSVIVEWLSHCVDIQQGAQSKGQTGP